MERKLADAVYCFQGEQVNQYLVFILGTAVFLFVCFGFWVFVCLFVCFESRFVCIALESILELTL